MIQKPQFALNGLLYGHPEGDSNAKSVHRYRHQPVTHLLNDFDQLVGVLYADQNEVSIAYREQARARPGVALVPPPAKIDTLKDLWQNILPQRILNFDGEGIKTRTIQGEEYSASNMSDGERVIFYLIGQALAAKKNSILIFDEPDLHVNKAILAKLWESIEAARPDCCFIYITHDVEFAVSRSAATKYAVHSYRESPQMSWDFDLISDENNLSEALIVQIIGSRRPILFVEGDNESLDSLIYRRIYDKFTIIPVGSCTDVIHAVVSFNAQPSLHHVWCAGIIDADGRTSAEAENLIKKNIHQLPVAELENILLIDEVFFALAKSFHFDIQVSNQKFIELKTQVFNQNTSELDTICLRYTMRRVDAHIKKINFPTQNLQKLNEYFNNAIISVNPQDIFEKIKFEITKALRLEDYDKILILCDNKNLFAEIAKLFGLTKKSLQQFIGRAIMSSNNLELNSAIRKFLPSIDKI